MKKEVSLRVGSKTNSCINLYKQQANGKLTLQYI